MILKRSDGRYTIKQEEVGYSWRRKLLIKNIDKTIIRNTTISQFLVYIENILENMMDGIHYIENLYNFTKDKTDL